MGQKHLIKTITHSLRVVAKIIKQSKEVLNKLPRRKEGRIFSAITRKIDTGLPALVVALCSNRPKCSDIRCHLNGVESLSQLYECCF